jgi:hypothetical protein
MVVCSAVLKLLERSGRWQSGLIRDIAVWYLAECTSLYNFGLLAGRAVYLVIKLSGSWQSRLVLNIVVL